jgi:phage terminase large subunit
MSPRVFPEVILPALMDYSGFAMLGGTPLGANQLRKAYYAARDGQEHWAAFMLRASETGAIPATELAIARANMSAEEYAQEFECSFDAVIRGAYFGELIAEAERAGRVCEVPYNPALGVTVAVDLGMRDAFACWFLQEHLSGGQIRAIDYREYFGKGLPQVMQEIRKLGYAITRWIAPHDIEVRELGTGRSRIEVARELGMDFDKSTAMPVQQGIDAVRLVLPMMVFDRVKCEYALDALRQYRAEWDEDKGIGSKGPLHDWTSHCADGLRTYATARSASNRTNWRQSLRELAELEPRKGIPRRVAA